MRWSTRKVLYYLAEQSDGTWSTSDTVKIMTRGWFRGRSLEDLQSMGLVTSRWQPPLFHPDDTTFSNTRSLRLEHAPTPEWHITPRGRDVARTVHEWHALMINSRRMRNRLASRAPRPG